MDAADPHRALIERYLAAYNAFDVRACSPCCTPT
jgi:hypothetical protein